MFGHLVDRLQVNHLVQEGQQRPERIPVLMRQQQAQHGQCSVLIRLGDCWKYIIKAISLLSVFQLLKVLLTMSLVE